MAPKRARARPPMEAVLMKPAPVGVGVGKATVVVALVELVADAAATRAATMMIFEYCILIVVVFFFTKIYSIERKTVYREVLTKV